MSSTIETVTVGLTREDIAALKRADSVSMHLYKGESFICAYLDDWGQPRVYTATEQRVFPDARGSHDRARRISVIPHASGYGVDGESGWSLADSPDATGFHMVSSAQFSDTYKTIVSLLKPGDELSLIWRADNNNDNHRRVNMHHDELFLQVKRADRQVMRFLLAATVGPDNSARMVRRR